MMIRGEYDNSMPLHHDRINNHNINNMNSRGEYDNRIRGRSMDSREGESSYGDSGGGGESGSAGLGSYAMMGIEMSGPPHHHHHQQQQEGGWMKRHRPNNDSGLGPPPPSQQMMMMERRGPPGGGGGNNINFNIENINNIMDGPLYPRGVMDRGDRMGGGGGGGPPPGPGGIGGIPASRGPPPGDGMGRFPPSRAEWDRDHVGGGGGGGIGPPPYDRGLPRGVGLGAGGAGGMGDGDMRSNPLPPSQDDQFGRGLRERIEPTRNFSASEEDQFGRQRPPLQRSTSGRGGGGFGGRGLSASSVDRRGSGVGSAASLPPPPGNQNTLHMSGRFVPGGGMDNPNHPDADEQRGFYHQHQKQHPQQQQQQQHQYSGVSPRESGYSAQPNPFPPSQPPSSHTADLFNQDATGQTNAIYSSLSSNNAHQERHRSQTPTPGASTISGVGGGANHPNQGAVVLSNESSANIVPESPTQTKHEEEDNSFICPPSPPPAAPSAYALALSRVIEMNEDMEFAHARLMMLEHEHKKIQARLKTLEHLQMEEGNAI